jgi:cation:H+ antiporter
MLTELVLLVLGLLLIIKGGDYFVSSSVRIAEILKMPRIVIGSTLVSLATTSPELVVSIMSGIKGESGLAVGNAVGSCICNIGLILGCMAALKHIVIHPRALRTPLIAMLFFGFVLLFMTMDLNLARWQGFLLIAAGVGYFGYDFLQHLRQPNSELEAEAASLEQEVVSGKSWLETPWGTAAQFLFGAVLVVAGSRLLVDSAVDIASALGVPSIVIGLTVVAVGTSLPELVTAISSSRRNVSDLAIGNVLGANIANLTLVVGSAASIRQVEMSRVTQLFNFPAMLLGMAILLCMIVFGRSISRKGGVGLLSYYGLYIALLVLLTLTVKQ